MKKLLYIVILLLTFQIATVSAQKTATEIHVFYGQGCPHCATLKIFLEDIKEKYPIEIYEYEVFFNRENRELFEKLCTAFGEDVKGVPTVFIDDKIFIGYSDSVELQIEEKIRQCEQQTCSSPLEKINNNTNSEQKITIPIVIAAAAVDAINPCEFAVLIILLTTILATHTKKKALLAGLFFSLAIFISYFLMGLGLYSAVSTANLAHYFYIIVSVLAVIIGLFNLKDYFWYGKWFIMEVPLGWRPKMKSLIKNVTSIPGAFLVGFAVSLFLLPCTSGPYLIILGLLTEVTTRNQAVLLLLLYNAIFIIPMIIITLAISLGLTTTERAEQWRQRKLKTLHLIAGTIMILLGVGMLLALLTGIL